MMDAASLLISILKPRISIRDSSLYASRGGKFGGNSYKISGGLHGVGVSVVNALSTYMRVEVCREGKKYMQEYNAGKPLEKVKPIGSCNHNGTYVLFQPDPKIFQRLDLILKQL